MYLHYELKTVPSTRQDEAIARLHVLHSLMAKTPGFLDAQIGMYLGKPDQYVVTRRFVDAAAHYAYRASDAAKEFGAQRVVGLYENQAVQEWEQGLETAGDTTGNFLALTTFTVDLARWQEFLEARKAHDATGVKLGGIVDFRTYRRIEKDGAPTTDVMVLGRRDGRAAFNRFIQSGEMEAWRKGLPAGLFTSTGMGFYEIVDEVFPA